MNNKDVILSIKNKGIIWVNTTLTKEITYTKPGSITYLLFGKKPSEQSLIIKFGHFGEYIAKELIITNKNLELMNCGLHKVNKSKKKDIDLLFKNTNTNIIYYRELKGNLELDTEKLPATINKCKDIEKYLIEKYPSYKINCGILHWSIYNRNILNKTNTIKSIEKEGLIIDHMNDFLQIIDIDWNEEDFYIYFKELGNKILFHKKY
jgi:hypothetical protein